MKKLLLTFLSVMPLAGWGQNLAQSDFTGVLVPQYISNGNNSNAAVGASNYPGPRLALVFRATVSNLTANTAYRYYVQAASQTDIGTTASGAGVLLMVNPAATTAATTYVTASTGSLSAAGQYGSFTTDANGAYTGWFALVNSNNARFQTPGTALFPSITLATDAVPGTIVARRALNQSVTVLGFVNAAGAANGTLLTGSSSATPKNLVFTYDNVAGTGRPLSVGLVESVGVATGTVSSTAGPTVYAYSTAAGAYTAVVPNALANGVRRVEQRSIVDNSIVGCASDADGTWPSGANTVNPTGGAGAALVLTATDTP
ncbi:hypothetical protein ACFQT0_14035 [Hymenobacter humi]|uniref:Uncharacterized protein n=1 Tax=Hymenobacter humi TaxID=1411620 RepID=A0ABW2U4M6_9BACT